MRSLTYAKMIKWFLKKKKSYNSSKMLFLSVTDMCNKDLASPCNLCLTSVHN